jgi:hypothetical protein
VDVAKVRNQIEGSFLRPGAHEILGEMGCSPDGERDWARVVALRGEDGAFRVELVDVIDETHHERIGSCQVLHTSVGRDLPICRRSGVSYGVVLEGVVVLDYTKDADHFVTGLVGVADTTDTACTGETDLVVGKLEDVELVDVDHDGHQDVRVTVRAARFHVPKQPPCDRTGFAGHGQPPPKIPNPPRRTIDLIAHGTTLTPTPAGARIMKTLEKLRPP